MYINKGSVYTFNKLPGYVEYDSIYFIINGVDEIDNNVIIETSVIVSLNNKFVKGDKIEKMSISKKDIKEYNFKKVKDEVLITKLLLLE